jgi:hypothetical protein
MVSKSDRAHDARGACPPQHVPAPRPYATKVSPQTEPNPTARYARKAAPVATIASRSARRASGMGPAMLTNPCGSVRRRS